MIIEYSSDIFWAILQIKQYNYDCQILCWLLILWIHRIVHITGVLQHG